MDEELHEFNKQYTPYTTYVSKSLACSGPELPFHSWVGRSSPGIRSPMTIFSSPDFWDALISRH